MVIDEEGKLAKKVLNSRATYKALVDGTIHYCDFIVGNALICPTEMIK